VNWSQPLIMLSITGIVTANTMIGPLLVDVARDLGVSVGQAGLLAAITAVPQAVASPISGLVSDRLGRRPMIVFSLASLGILSIAGALAPSFAVLASIRLAAGLVGGLAPVSLMASVGEILPPERVARGMGWFNMGFSAAAIAGVPLMAAIAGTAGWRWSFAAVSAVLLVAALGVRLGFPSLPPRGSSGGLVATYRAIWNVPALFSVLGANLVERSLFVMTTIYLPAFLMLDYRLTAAAVAPAIVLVALGSVAGNVLGGWLGDRRLPRPAIFVVAQILAATLGLTVFGAGLAFAVTVAIAALMALANASSRPAFLAYTTDLAPHERGALFGLVSLTNQGGFVVGSVVGAAVIGREGPAGLALAALALGLLAAALALPLLRSRRA
jgi:predicted MFS family arabinose efflux permease